MPIFELGLDSVLLDDVLVGDKKVECRLNHGKFAKFKVGDRLRLRRDIYRNSVTIAELKDQAEAEITQVDHFDDFESMFISIPFRDIIPDAPSLSEAVNRCSSYYSAQQIKELGILAIHIRLIWPII